MLLQVEECSCHCRCGLWCLVAFWGFHPYNVYVLSFLKCSFVTCFCCFLWGGERYEWCLDGVVVWGR